MKGLVIMNSQENKQFEILGMAILNAVKTGEDISREELAKIYDGDFEEMDRNSDRLQAYFKALDEVSENE